MSKHRKKSISVTGSWLPLPLNFLRSSAAAELSPHGAKLLLDVLALLGPNAAGNGDLSLTPKVMAVRGWSSRSTLHAAIQELLAFGLLIQSRQGSRLDCSLYACTLYPLDCDQSKIDIKPWSFQTTDWMQTGTLAKAPTFESPATWRRTRKLKTVAPPRDDLPKKRPATGRTTPENIPK